MMLDRKTLAALAAALVLFLISCVSPVRAQFDAQQTYVSSSGGAANAFSVTVPNINQASDLVGVPIRVFMSASNSGAATLTVSNGATNVVTNVAINKLTTSGLSALVGNEVRSGQISTLVYDGSVFELTSPNLSLATTQTQNGFSPATNLAISAGVSANQLTISLLAANTNAAPTVANPVLVPFRDPTIAAGDPQWVTLTSSASLTIGSGSTMGCVNAQMCRLWVVAFNNAGSLQVCAFNALSGYSVAPINEGTLQSSAAGTTGGSSAQTFYCNSSLLTNNAVRILGYVEVQESTAGLWSTAPTFVQLFGPGVKRPGDVVQNFVSINSSQLQTSSATMTTLRSVSFAPSSAADPIIITTNGQAFAGGSCSCGVQVTRSATIVSGPRLTIMPGVSTPGYFSSASMGADLPNSTSAQTYNIQAQSNGTNNVAYPPSGANEVIEIKEIMG